MAAPTADPDVRCVILAGEGRGFCAGLDLEDSAAGVEPARDPQLQAGIDPENRTQILSSFAQDSTEAIQALLAKRPPEFRNR